LDQLRGQRTAAEQYIDTLRSRLAALQTRALMFRPYSARLDARRMPDDLAEDLVRTVNEFRTQSNALAAKGEAETALKAQFQADIERYRELHAVNPHRGATTALRCQQPAGLALTCCAGRKSHAFCGRQRS